MTGLLVALGLLAALPEQAPAVRLAPFRCANLSDQDIRPLLQLEIRERLLDEAPASPAEFVLVSVACDGDIATVMAVRQHGGAPIRRGVPLGDAVGDARPRALALAIAELLRVGSGAGTATPPIQPAPEVTASPSPGPTSDADAEEPGQRPFSPARLELVEPLIMLPLTADRRAGARTRLGNTDLPTGTEAPNFYVLSIEPFVDFAWGHGVVASLTLPVTWTDGAGIESAGALANLTGGIRHASGDRLRIGVGAALSLALGQAAPAQAQSNRLELDRFRDGTTSLRLQADALWRQGRVHLQGEAALLLLADGQHLGTLLRGGLAGGVSFARTAVGVEYLVIADPGRDSFTSGSAVADALVLTVRQMLSPTTTLGLHFYLAPDQEPNPGFAGIVSMARSL